MAVAKELSEVHPDFMQSCPFCGRNNRIVMHGLFVLGSKREKHPDMGYSFCNCRNMFYTDIDNVWIPHPYFIQDDGTITMPDPYFAWPDPYQFDYWDVRKYQILWPMDSLCEHLKELGYEIIEAKRDFDLNSKTPQHFHIKVKR